MTPYTPIVIEPLAVESDVIEGEIIETTVQANEAFNARLDVKQQNAELVRVLKQTRNAACHRALQMPPLMGASNATAEQTYTSPSVKPIRSVGIQLEQREASRGSRGRQ